MNFNKRSVKKVKHVVDMIPTFYFQDVYRCVKVYHHTYKTFTKKRWVNMKILDMFTKEFAAYDAAYYEKAILEGRIRVNKKPVTLEYQLKDNDCIEHDALRIEPPVYNTEIPVVFEDNEFVVINKPPSMPVHMCGSYLFNTVINLLRYVYDRPNLYSVHRLDKLTSGLLVLAKSSDLALKFQKDLLKHEIGKTYIARVLGDFPCKVGEELVVDKSIYCVSAKLGKYDFCKTEEQEQQGKTAKTIFKKIWYDETTNSSLVECRPQTGRTHQIRVHCLSVGCSIINDVNYGGIFIGNPLEDIVREKLGLEKSESESAEEQKEKEQPELDKDGKPIKGEITGNPNDYEPQVQKKIKPETETENETEKVPKEEEEEKTTDKKEPEVFAEVSEEDQTYVMEIWLHSVRYTFQEKVFETPYPYWANIETKFSAKTYARTSASKVTMKLQKANENL